MASAYLRPNPIQITIGGSGQKLVANKDVAQSFVLVDGGEAGKPEAFAKVVADECGASDSKVIVFCNTKLGCEKLAFAQRRSGSGAVRSTATRTRGARRALSSPATPRVDALRHHVAARGLDVKNVTRVINYDLPSGDDTQSYVHRIGHRPRRLKDARSRSISRRSTARWAPPSRPSSATPQPVPDCRRAGRRAAAAAAAAAGAGRGSGSGARDTAARAAAKAAAAGAAARAGSGKRRARPGEHRAVLLCVCPAIACASTISVLVRQSAHTLHTASWRGPCAHR